MNVTETSQTFWSRMMRFWLAYEPLRLMRWEVVILRVVIALLIWDTHTTWLGVWSDPAAAVRQMTVNALDGGVNYTSQPHPSGFGLLMDFSFLANDRIEKPLEVATGISLLLYVLGIPAWFSLAIPCLYTVGLYSLLNSQGSIGHTAQGIHLVMLCLWLAGIWSFFCKRRGRGLPEGFNDGQFGMSWARQGLMAVYVVSAVTKLWMTKGLWFVTAKYFPLHLVKNNGMEYYDTLNESARHLEWLPQFLMDHPLISQILFGLALPLELFAFLALLNRRIAAVIGIGLIMFHESVTQLTHLSFIFNKVLLLFLFVSPFWWLLCSWRGRCAKVKPTD